MDLSPFILVESDSTTSAVFLVPKILGHTFNAISFQNVQNKNSSKYTQITFTWGLARGDSSSLSKNIMFKVSEAYKDEEYNQTMYKKALHQ